MKTNVFALSQTAVYLTANLTLSSSLSLGEAKHELVVQVYAPLLLNRELLSFYDVDALRQALLGSVDVGLREDECALSVVNIDGCVSCLKFLDACLDVFKAGYVLNLKLSSVACLLVPSETAAGWQECLIAFSANQNALEDVSLLLSGDTIAAFCLDCFPRTAEGNGVACAVALAYALQLSADAWKVGEKMR